MSTLTNYPSPTVREFGEAVMSSLFDASIRKALGGLGGCVEYNTADFPEEHFKYIEAYLENGANSIAVTYAAMRDKAIELGEP